MVFGKKSAKEGKLASSRRVRRWLVGKPAIAADAPILAETDGAATSSEKSTQNPNDKINPLLMLTRLTALIAVLGIILIAVSWIALGMTVKPTIWLNGTGWFVKVGSWVQGQAPTGAVAFALNEPVDRSALAKLERITDPSSSGKGIITIIANPQDTITYSSLGTIVVNGQDTGIPAKKKISIYGSDQYLAVCEMGACEVGELLTVPVDQIVGEVTGGVGLEGLVKVDSNTFQTSQTSQTSGTDTSSNAPTSENAA